MKKKVRIAVAIDSTGAWSSSGWGREGGDVSDKEKMSFAIECLETGENQYFIEAELDVPEVKIIKPFLVDRIESLN